MKYQILFSQKNIINMASTEFAHSMLICYAKCVNNKAIYVYISLIMATVVTFQFFTYMYSIFGGKLNR